MNNNQFGAKLKEIRKAKGLTQFELAEKAGIDEKHLSRIENGKNFPFYPTLLKLLNALDLNIEEVGLDITKLVVNSNPLMVKAMQILNSANNDRELKIYLTALTVTQKILKNEFNDETEQF